jgi:hypothetical protein
MRVIRSALVGIALLALSFAAVAQDAARVLELCDKPSLDLSEASWLALSSAGLIDPESSSDAALDRLRELGWLARASRKDAKYFPTTVGEFSFIAMKAYGMRGGIGYALAPGPRYAFRELGYLGLIPSSVGQDQVLPGTFAVKTIGKLDELRGVRR